jgi:hypothetical protein
MAISNMTQAQSIMKPGVCTSSTRPASPYDGQVIYETDTDRAMVWDNSAWVVLSATGVWTSFTPTWTQSVAISKTVSYSKYIQIGKTVIYQGYMVATSAGTASNPIGISIPVTASSQYATAYTAIGSAQFVDVTPGYYTYSGVANLSSGVITITTLGTAANLVGVNPAVTVASTDIISWSVMYEAA